MLKHTVFILAGLAACAADPSGPGGGDDDGGDDAPPFTNGVSTLSGHAMSGYVDGKRGKARFNNPVSCAYKDGKVYVSDFDNGKIRVVDAESGETSTLINQQNFRKPFALAFGPDGTLWATTDKNPNGTQQTSLSGTIWRIDIGKKEATPVAIEIGRPRGLAVMSNGKLAVADYTNHVVSLVDPASGAVQPLAGTWQVAGMVDAVGTAAMFNIPYAVVVKDGKLIVADYGNNRLREVAMDGTVRTLAGVGAAGFGDGAMAMAKFNKPQGAFAAGGDVFITDLDNYRIRKVTGDVSTISGTGEGGYVDSDDLLAAEFYGLEGMCGKSDGSVLYVADGGRGEAVPHNFIRSIKLK